MPKDITAASARELYKGSPIIELLQPHHKEKEEIFFSYKKIGNLKYEIDIGIKLHLITPNKTAFIQCEYTFPYLIEVNTPEFFTNKIDKELATLILPLVNRGLMIIYAELNQFQHPLLNQIVAELPALDEILSLILQSSNLQNSNSN